MGKQSERQKFFASKDMKWEDFGEGIQRQILGYDNQIMMVKVKFAKGAVAALHAHFHTQSTYCESERFDFTIDGEKKIIEAGDGVYISPNKMHGAVCLEEGILIDVFSPVREDFLD